MSPFSPRPLGTESAAHAVLHEPRPTSAVAGELGLTLTVSCHDRYDNPRACTNASAVHWARFETASGLDVGGEVALSCGVGLVSGGGAEAVVQCHFRAPQNVSLSPYTGALAYQQELLPSFVLSIVPGTSLSFLSITAVIP
jgi:hypothetical protein